MIGQLASSHLALAIVIGTILSRPAGLMGQGAKPGTTQTAPASAPWMPPRTLDGQPDLEGVWVFSTLTSLERPPTLKDKEFLTDGEAALLEQEKADFNETFGNSAAEARRAPGGTFAEYCAACPARVWFDDGSKVIPSRRTSLIVDPPDGRIPRRPGVSQSTNRPAGADSVFDRSLFERCLQSLNAGPPMRPGPYNNLVQILQSPGYVVIHNEMIHDARIIPLDGRPHLSPELRQWKGDSRGRWEGNTLVVETQNFTDKTSFFGSRDGLHVIERLTRLDADTINYQFTVTDPQAFTSPWSAVFPLTRTDGQVFEYACHEGNLGLVNILQIARSVEAKSVEETQKPK